MENARQYECKPEHSKRWVALVDDVKCCNTYLDYLNVDYKALSDYPEPEQIYIYFHKDEFDIHTRDRTKYYYLKEHIERRNKFVLKCIVEQEIKYNLPKYLNLYAGTVPETVCEYTDKIYMFDRYCLSTVFEQDELAGIFQGYEDNYKSILAYHESLNRVLQWVEKVGGFPEAVRIIRKGVIEDLQKDFVRFEESFRYDKTDDLKNDLEGAIPYIQRVKNLLTYDTLYLSPGMGIGQDEGSEAFCNGDPLDMEEEFDEPKDEGSDIEEQAA